MRLLTNHSIFVVALLILTGCASQSHHYYGIPKRDDASTSLSTGTISGRRLRSGCWVVKPKLASKIIVDAGETQITARCVLISICCYSYHMANLVVLIEEGHAYRLRFEGGEIVVYDSDSGRMVAREKGNIGAPEPVETVCSSLSGLTSGLYDLCVAYCEKPGAHMLSTAYGHDPEFFSTPNRKILEKYNRKKSASDPPMPCVQQEGCPCWTAEQLSTALPPSMNYHHINARACLNPRNLKLGSYAIENFENVAPESYTTSGDGFQLFTTDAICGVTNRNYPGAPPDTLQPITTAEAESCKNLLIAHANAHKTDRLIWDCFAE